MYLVFYSLVKFVNHAEGALVLTGMSIGLLDNTIHLFLNYASITCPYLSYISIHPSSSAYLFQGHRGTVRLTVWHRAQMHLHSHLWVIYNHQFTCIHIVQNNNNSRLCCWGGMAVAQDVEQVMSIRLFQWHLLYTYNLKCTAVE